jgi:hypothetical protein
MERLNSFTITAGVLLFVATVVPLHLLQPGYDPANQLMSELALGPYGWAMVIAFAGLAMSMLGVQGAAAALGASRPLRMTLFAAAAFFAVSGIFPLGRTSDVHIAAIAIAFVLAVLAMYLYPANAGRGAAAAPRAVSWSLAAGVAGSVALGHTLMPMGIGQRMAAAFLLAWLLVLGIRLRA